MINMVLIIIINNNNTFEPGSQSPASAMSAICNCNTIANIVTTNTITNSNIPDLH
jgi:hypothetical protein